MRSVEIDDVRWAFREAGSGPALFFFHGTLGSHLLFEDQIAVLSDRYRCVAFDWPGHGGSGWNSGGWHVYDLVHAVPRLMDALGERSPTLIGVSQGGAISMRVAINYPDRVAALVTMSAGADPLPPEITAQNQALGRRLATATDAEAREALRGLQRDVFHVSGWVEANPEQAEREMRWMLSHAREAMPLLLGIPGDYDSIEDQLRLISCPTLIVWGEHDPRAERGPDMAAAIPDSKLVVIPNAGHHVSLDSPSRTTQLLSEFLDAQPRETTPV